MSKFFYYFLKRANGGVANTFVSPLVVGNLRNHRDLNGIESHPLYLKSYHFSVISGKGSLRDRVAFFSQMNSFRPISSPNKPELIRKHSLTNDISSQQSPQSTPNPEDLGVFRRSGSVRDLARRFGSNTSLNSNSNSNNSNQNFTRNVTQRRSWCFSSSVNKIEIDKSEKKDSDVSPLSDSNPLIKGLNSNENDQQAINNTRRKANFLNVENEVSPDIKSPMVMPKIRKSMKLAELEKATENDNLMNKKTKIRIRRKSSFGKDQQVNTEVNIFQCFFIQLLNIVDRARSFIENDCYESNMMS